VGGVAPGPAARGSGWIDEHQGHPAGRGHDTNGSSGGVLIREPRLLASERECQAGDDEGREKDRQNPLSRAPEGNGFALGGVEGLSSAGVSAAANLEGVTSRFDWYLDRVVHFERSGTLTVNHDVVRATSDLHSDCLVGQLQRRGHF
jgi:hypothetical protein